MTRMAIQGDFTGLIRRIFELEQELTDPRLTSAERLQIEDSLQRHRASLHEREANGISVCHLRDLL